MNRGFYFACLMMMVGLFYSETPSAAGPSVTMTPKPKYVKLSGGSIPVSEAKLFVEEDVRSRYEGAIIEILGLLGNQSKGIRIDAKVATTEDKIPPEVLEGFTHPEAYWLEAHRDGIRIQANDALGVLHGLTTLEKLVLDGKRMIPEGRIVDWPDQEVRAVHIGIRNATPESVRSLIRKARRAQFNTFIMALADGVSLSTTKRIARRDAWSGNEWLEIVRFARENGLEVIPEIKLLTHQEKLLKNAYPGLMFNKSSYDPRKKETYATVLPILEEVIALIHPGAIHIGHDEVAGLKPQSRKENFNPGDEPLPPDLYLKDVENLYAFLAGKGVKTWMWGDMLISPEEFPGMRPNHLHGISGYAALRTKIPKDIVICDWHYIDDQHDFPSSKAFADAGHSVLGATWKKVQTTENFSRYVANMPQGGIGMIATTWFHVQRKEWNVVDEIITTSGEAFWNAR